MNDYMSQLGLSFMDYFMYYLSFALIILSFLEVLIVYQIRAQFSRIRSIILSVIFYVMLLNVAVFIATYIFVLRQ